MGNRCHERDVRHCTGYMRLISHLHTVEVGGSRPPSPTAKHQVRRHFIRIPPRIHGYSVKRMKREVERQVVFRAMNDCAARQG